MRKNTVQSTGTDEEKIQVHLVIPADLLDRFDALAAKFHISRNALNLFAWEKFINAMDTHEAQRAK